MTLNNIFTGTLLAAGISSNGGVHGSTVTMEHAMGTSSMHLTFDQSSARNAARVNVMNSGCALDTSSRGDFDFNTLRELQFNATNNLEISSVFLESSSENEDVTITDLKKNQLVDFFSMDKECGHNSCFNRAVKFLAQTSR